MSVPGPTLGPCESWIDGDAVALCCTGPSSDASVFDDVAVVASMVMFELSGRQFTGLCSRTVRPCRGACGCFGVSRSTGFRWQDGHWYDPECGDRCGCGTESYVRLAGYPVRQVTEVKIDGEVLDPSEYRLDNYRKLIRMADPGPPVVNAFWPGCQNLALDDDQPGTFSISYQSGVDPPQLGRDAAAVLACELWKACGQGTGECKLPSKATKIVRQGVTIERVVPIAQMLREGSSGVPAIDTFLAAYNATGMRRRPAVWSPDLQPFPRQTG